MSSLSPNLQIALDAFRERVLNDNVATLSHLLSRLENQASEEASEANRSDIETQAAILRTLTMTYLPGQLPPSVNISRARDLLEVDNNRSLLAEHFHLDSVLTGDIDAEKIQHWFASVQNDLASLLEDSNYRSDLEGHNWPTALPSELQNLMTNVRGIIRPGLPYFDHFGTDFFVSGFDNQSSEKVFSPSGHDELTLVWPGWDVAAAVRLAKADMNPSTTLVLFCRDGNEDSSKWAWRYGICDEEWCSELFNDIGTFLNWYATYGVPTEEDIARERITVDWGWPHSSRGPRGAISVDALLRSGAIEQ